MRSINGCIADIIKSKNIAIFSHMAPDADALASALALKKLIKYNIPNCEKIIDLFFDYEELGDVNGAILKGVVHNYQRCHNYDLTIALDCASLSRLGKWADLYNKGKIKVNFDHHTTNENYADNNMIVKTSSTCEGLYLIAQAKGCVIPDDVCSLIYSGIITDTNNLTQGVITTRTYKVIAEMMARNINLDALNDHFFKNNTKSKAYLLKKALDSLKFYNGDRIAMMRISKEALANCDATTEDTLGIVNHGLEIKGVDISILALKQEDNSFYVSLRSRNGVNVANIATKMGGGGHEQVAAFQFVGTYNEMFDKLICVCKDELSKHPHEQNIEDLFGGDDEDFDSKKIHK